MIKNKPSTDGFTIPRRSTEVNQTKRLGIDSMNKKMPPPPLQTRRKTHSQESPLQNNDDMKFSNELNASLDEIDKEAKKPRKKRWLPTKRQVKWFFIILLIIVIGVLGYLGVKAWLASNKVFDGNVLDLFGTGQPLQMDENGRSNIVLFGTSEDSGAHEDAGPNLTDSIMVASLDQNENLVMLTSVPRDLWVEYDRACLNGYEGKINAVYQCGSEDGANEEAGAQMLMDTIGTVYGLDMHYYLHVNNTAVQDAVNAVGGIDITIESEDPRGIYDPNFDWECNYECEFVRHPNGPAHLDGKQALLLARARDSTGMGYGLADGNFAREQYQQKILVALRDKAASAGTLANPAAVSQLIDSLGNNVRTNFSTGEVRTLINVAQEVTDERITTLRLDDEADPQVTTGNMGGQSIVQPILGVYDYSGIHAYIQRHLSADPAVLEAATIEVLNGSGVEGAAQVEADRLAAEDLIITQVSNAPEGSYGTITIYQINAEKTATKEKLETLYSTGVVTTIPAGIEPTTDFIVVVGAVE